MNILKFKTTLIEIKQNETLLTAITNLRETMFFIPMLNCSYEEL